MSHWWSGGLQLPQELLLPLLHFQIDLLVGGGIAWVMRLLQRSQRLPAAAHISFCAQVHSSITLGWDFCTLLRCMQLLLQL